RRLVHGHELQLDRAGRFGHQGPQARSDCAAVTTVTGTPSRSTRDGRSKLSQCETRRGSVDTITSSNCEIASAVRTETNGSVSPKTASTLPHAEYSSTG